MKGLNYSANIFLTLSILGAPAFADDRAALDCTYSYEAQEQLVTKRLEWGGFIEDSNWYMVRDTSPTGVCFGPVYEAWYQFLIRDEASREGDLETGLHYVDRFQNLSAACGAWVDSVDREIFVRFDPNNRIAELRVGNPETEATEVDIRIEGESGTLVDNEFEIDARIGNCRWR